MLYPNARIPAGSWILVTGVNGLVASNTANLLLEYGYRVRGTVRDAAKSSWLQERFDRQYGPGKFELVTVKDLAQEKAFDEAVKGFRSSQTRPDTANMFQVFLVLPTSLRLLGPSTQRLPFPVSLQEPLTP